MLNTLAQSLRVYNVEVDVHNNAKDGFGISVYLRTSPSATLLINTYFVSADDETMFEDVDGKLLSSYGVTLDVMSKVNSNL